MRFLKLSTTVTIQMGPAVDKTDGVTAETGLSPTVEISKAGAAFAARNSATAIAHDAQGWYRVELNTTDTNTLGPLMAKFDDDATHLPVWHEFIVLPAMIYDSLIAGSDRLDTNVTHVTDTAQTAGDLAALIVTVDDLLDTEVAAIKTETASIQADTNDIQTRLPAALTADGNMKADTLRVGGTLQTAGDIVALVTTIDDFLDTEIAAIKAKTDQLTFTAANKVDASLQAASDLVAAVGNKIADHVLRRSYASARASADGEAISFRSLLGAIAKLVNKWTISGATLTVYHEDDTTSAGTQALTTNASADPITEIDTA